MTRKVADRVACPSCGEFKVPGGAMASHRKSCESGGPIKRRRSRYRELFFAVNGIGPYPCYFGCERSVSFDEVIVHHIDENFTNDAIDNLTAAHRSCHNSHHFKDLWSDKRQEFLASQTRGNRKPHSEETKRKISETKKARKQAPTDLTRHLATEARWGDRKKLSDD